MAERERARRLLEAAAQAHRRRLAVLEGALEQSLDTSTIQLVDVDCMTGVEFEEFVAALFSGPGRIVEKTKASGDQGGDVIVRQGAHREVVQAKRYLGTVSNAAVQEVVAAKAVYGCHSAWVVTNAWFTSGAEQLAEANEVELVSRERLRLLLESGRAPERRR
jgi:restriction system protein